VLVLIPCAAVVVGTIAILLIISGSQGDRLVVQRYLPTLDKLETRNPLFRFLLNPNSGVVPYDASLRVPVRWRLVDISTEDVQKAAVITETDYTIGGAIGQNPSSAANRGPGHTGHSELHPCWARTTLSVVTVISVLPPC
jgi:hypothetical protein